MSNKQSLMLIDGMSLLFRGFFATSYRGQFMLTSKGIPTNAIYGFVRYMWDAIQRFEPTHVACCWDMGSKTFRTEKFADYKGNRAEPPVELIPQFDLIKEVTEGFGIMNLGLKGFEADDLIGTLATNHRDEIDVRILTGDHDSLQLVHERVHSIIMKKGMSNYMVYTPQLLMEEKGLTPAQLIDLKGLMGDPSDNYPGVHGIGEKTALKLLHEYETIDGILDNLDSLSKGIRKKIDDNLDMLHLSRDLAAIRCDVPIELVLEESKWEIDFHRIRTQLEKIESQRLIKMIEQDIEDVIVS